MEQEQTSRIQMQQMITEVGPNIIRAVNRADADAATDLEQHQQVAQHRMRTDVHPAVVRAHTTKAAEKMAFLAQIEQVGGSEQPSVEAVNRREEVNQHFARMGGAADANVAMEQEQTSRIQMQQMITEVGPNIIRAVNRADADAATDLEQHQQVAQHRMRTDVHPAVVRAHTTKAAEKMAFLAQIEQVGGSEQPSVEAVNRREEVNQHFARMGRSRRASAQATVEQTARAAQPTFVNEVASAIRRTVNAKQADSEIELEQHQRAAQHHMRTEVHPAVLRSINGKAANRMMFCAQIEQVAKPAAPPAGVWALKSAVNESVRHEAAYSLFQLDAADMCSIAA